MATVQGVAEWMQEKIEKDNYLEQESAVYDIQSLFGEEFIYVNDNGNLAISRSVLKEFKRLTIDTVVWSRGEKAWRTRGEYDTGGRQSD